MPIDDRPNCHVSLPLGIGCIARLWATLRNIKNCCANRRLGKFSARYHFVARLSICNVFRPLVMSSRCLTARRLMSRIPPLSPPSLSGNSSVVEHRLAKARVEGSNPFSRSNFQALEMIPLSTEVLLLHVGEWARLGCEHRNQVWRI